VVYFFGGSVVSGVTVITDADFEATVLQAQEPVLVYFWASWCGPCRLMSPLMDGLANKYGDRLKIVKMEVDPNPNAVAQYKVEGVPAIRLFRRGEVIEASEGAISKQKLETLIETHLQGVH
jgi:thioredoxin 1